MSNEFTTVLVTGGNGMVGSCIKDLTRSNTNLSYRYVYHNGRSDADLTDRNSVENLFQRTKPDQVIHLAAAVGGLFLNQKQNAKMLTDNLSMNLNIIQACHRHNIQRGIFILSSCIFPTNPSKFPMTEDMVDESRPHPSNEGYAYGKRILCSLAKHYNNDYSRHYICLTPVNLYGPYDNYNPDASHVIPGLINRFHTGDFTCYGTGKPLRQFLYAPDFAKIIIRVLQDTNFPHQHMICAAPEVTIKEMAKTLAHVIGGKNGEESLKHDTSYGDGCMKKTVSHQRLEETYPDIYNYLVTLKHGLELTYKWFQETSSLVRT